MHGIHQHQSFLHAAGAHGIGHLRRDVLKRHLRRNIHGQICRQGLHGRLRAVFNLSYFPPMAGLAPQDPFDLIRSWFLAFNAGDLEALMALYQDEAVVDAGTGVSTGRDAVGGGVAALVARSARRTVRMIARVDPGAMHAEWRGHERNPDGEIATSAGYDDFWIEDRLIRTQRSVLHPLSFQAEEETAPVAGARPARQYPAQPIVGVGAVIVQDGKVVLVKRRFEPLAGQWSLPGG